MHQRVSKPLLIKVRNDRLLLPCISEVRSTAVTIMFDWTYKNLVTHTHQKKQIQRVTVLASRPTTSKMNGRARKAKSICAKSYTYTHFFDAENTQFVSALTATTSTEARVALARLS